MPMPMPPMHMSNPQSGNGPEEDEDLLDGGQDDAAEMDELDKAANAGDEFAAKEFFKTPEGVDPGTPAPPDDPSMGITPEVLQQLLELLKQKQQAADGQTDVSGGMMPPPMPG